MSVSERLAADRRELNDTITGINWNKDADPFSLPECLWGNTAFDFLEPAKRDEILSSMFRFTLRRALATMPVYASQAYREVVPDDFRSLNDFVNLPILVKDGIPQAGIRGFREPSLDNPSILRPADIDSALVYKSGGTKGLSTPTFITEADLAVEAQSLGLRSFLPGGFESGDVLYNFYNPTHKGGELIKRAALLTGAKTVITRRPEDDLAQCISDLKAYSCTAIAAVQPPIENQQETIKKGSGVSFLNLYAAAPELFGKQIKNAFITGYPLPQELISFAEDIGLKLFTAWGSTEAIVGATSTVIGPETRLCKYNNQHLVLGPHFLGLAKISDGKLLPVKEGEDGIIFVNNIARQGTIYINYAIGDKAQLVSRSCQCGRTTPVISAIRRIDNPQEIAAVGCRYG